MADDEQLDDVISELVDEDPEEGAEGAPTSAAEAPSEELNGSGSEDVQPVRLTERAANQVKKIKAEEGLDDDVYLRVAVEGGGCSGLSYKLGFDEHGEDDQVVESHGVQIVVDFRHKLYLDGIVVDYPDGLDARGFTFDNPNASETCGCGSSFAT